MSLSQRATNRAWHHRLVLAPAVLLLVLATMAFSYSGPLGALPYVAVAGLCFWHAARPSSIAWGVPFAAFVVFTAAVATVPLRTGFDGPVTEWVGFVVLGVVLTGVLWFARPRPGA